MPASCTWRSALPFCHFRALVLCNIVARALNLVNLVTSAARRDRP
jgi:hypothetical protein